MEIATPGRHTWTPEGFSFAKLLNEFVFSEKLCPISFAKLLNEFVFSEELFPISFPKLLNEVVFSEELLPISFAKLLTEFVFLEELFPISKLVNTPVNKVRHITIFYVFFLRTT